MGATYTKTELVSLLDELVAHYSVPDNTAVIVSDGLHNYRIHSVAVAYRGDALLFSLEVDEDRSLT